jgi:hypothetical protein
MQTNMNKLVSYYLGSIEPDDILKLLEEKWNYISNSYHDGPRRIYRARINRPFWILF